MNDKHKTKNQLIIELKELRKKYRYLEKQNQQYNQTNDDLIENERIFRSFFERAPLSYQSLDKNGNILIINNAWLKTLGYSTNEVVGQWFGDFLSETSVEGFKKCFPELKKFGTIQNAEFEMIKKNGSRIFVSLNGTANFDKTGEFSHSHCIMQDVTERKLAEAEIKRRDAILETLGIASEKFLRTPSLDDNAFQKIIERLGLATEVSRVYIFENQPGKNNTLLTSQRYEWVAPGVTSQINNPQLQNFPYKAVGMGRWEQSMKENKIIFGHIKNFPKKEKELFVSQAIKSMLAVPICIEGKWWGFIGFDQCDAEREWFPAEIEALKTAAAILGAMIERKKAEDVLKEALFNTQQKEKEIKALLEGTRAIHECITFDKTAQRIFYACKELIGATAGYVALLSKDGKENEVLFLDPGGLPCDVDPELAMPIRGLRAESFKKADVVFDNNFSTSKWMKYMPAGHVELENVMFAPLKFGEKIFGLIGLANKPGGFDKEDVRKAKSFGELAAVALNFSKNMSALQDSENRYRTLFTQSPDAIFLIDPKTTLPIEFNQLAPELVGYPAKEYAKLRISDYEIMNAGEIKARIENVLQKGHDKFESKMITKNGEIRDVIISISVIEISGQQIFQSIVRDITKRKKAEEALKSSEEKFRLFFENNPDYCYVVSPKGVLMNVNKAAIQCLGYERDELVGKPLATIYATETHSKMSQLFKKWLKTGKLYNEEITIITKTGERRSVLLYAEMIRDDEGRPKHSLSIQRDITEQKQAEITLRENKESYKELADSITDIFFAMDQDLNYTYWNKASETLTGIRAEEALGKSLLEVFPDTPWVRKTDKVYRKVLSTRQSQTFLIEVDLGGEHYTLEISVYPSKTGISVFVKDISERRLFEEALRESDERNRSIVAAMAEGVVLQNKKGEIITCNKAAEDILGLTHEKLTSKTSMDQKWQAIHEDGSPFPGETHPAMVTLKTGKPLRNVIIGLPKPDGKITWISINSQPLMKPDEIEPYSVVTSFTDVSERLNTEKEFKKTSEQLRNLSTHLQNIREEERTHIAREIHDDLGQALTAIKMDLSWLQNKLQTKEEKLTKKIISTKELTDSIIQTVQRISTELRPGLLDDLGLVPAIEWQTEEFKKRTGISYNLNLAAQDFVMDKNLSTIIFRIFQESLTNVLRHANATDVYINFKKQKNNIILSIRDNGVGITEEQISDPTSLGLLGIRERLIPFNGLFNITGEKNKGTTVTVTIPIK